MQRVSKLPTYSWRTTPTMLVSLFLNQEPCRQISSIAKLIWLMKRLPFRYNDSMIDAFTSLFVETKAFRALSMSGQGKVKQAVIDIKTVLFKNMKNYTCWHIMGIVHRREK